MPPPLHVPLQQSEPIVHVSPGCPIPAPAQQTLLFMSQLFEQQSVFPLHCADVAPHMPPSPVVGASDAESPGAGLSLTGPSPGACESCGACESWGDDVSGVLDESIVLGASLLVESGVDALSVDPPSLGEGVEPELPHAARGYPNARTSRSSDLRMSTGVPGEEPVIDWSLD
jgi:hypothetical protein